MCLFTLKELHLRWGGQKLSPPPSPIEWGRVASSKSTFSESVGYVEGLE